MPQGSDNRTVDDRLICRVTRYDDGVRTHAEDTVAMEEPLEIRVAGETVAITMRTPGADRELALGFLYGEGIIGGLGDIGRAGHCGRPGTPEFGNVIDVLPSPGCALDPETIRAGRRGTLTSSACGVCGRERIDDLVDRCLPLTDGHQVDVGFIFEAQEKMLRTQDLFSATGGVHAASAFCAQGNMLAGFEDVGRHNAVDKVIGALLSNNKAKAEVLVVSSRASFEIVQKAAVARISTVVAVSAASSLAVSLAEAMGITLVGFARKGRLVVYTGELTGA